MKKIRIKIIIGIIVILASFSTNVVNATNDNTYVSSVLIKKNGIKYKAKSGRYLFLYKRYFYKKYKDGFNRVSRNKTHDIFGVHGKYIYYTTLHCKLCRIKINGKYEKKYNFRADKVELVKEGYIYYTNSKRGLYRIKNDGSNKIKLIPQKGLYNYIILNDKIVYMKSDVKNGVINTSIYAVSLDGSQKKKIYSIDDDRGQVVDFVANSKDIYIYTEVDNKEIIMYTPLANAISDIEPKIITSLNEDFNHCRLLDIINDKLYVCQNNQIVFYINKNGEKSSSITIDVDENMWGDSYNNYGIIVDEINDYIVIQIKDYRNYIFVYDDNGNMVLKKRYKKNGVNWEIVSYSVKENYFIVKFSKFDRTITKKYKLS